MPMIPASFTEDMTHSEGLACRTSLEATTYCGSMFFGGAFFDNSPHAHPALPVDLPIQLPKEIRWASMWLGLSIISEN